MERTTGNTRPGIGLLWRGDPAGPPPLPGSTRFARIFEELASIGADAEPVVYADEVAGRVRARLTKMDAVLVWVDPIVGGQDRTVLDGLLRDVSAVGTFVSAHPDVILAMGTKEVLYRTRGMPWGTDTYLYRTAEELLTQLPLRLRSSGARVLKQYRGSGGNGVWKVELARDAPVPAEVGVRVQHGARGAVVEQTTLGAFVERCRVYFDSFGGAGCMVDQPYAERLGEGMIRAYMVYDRVVGFGHQFVTALMPPREGEAGPPDPPPRLYYDPSKPEFQRLKRLLESGWLAEMQGILDIAPGALPVIWDADFLLGPKTATGEDTYVLCEINVSGVFPIPDSSVAPLARAVFERAVAARSRKSASPR